jgi:hypothetical protein
MIFNGETCTHIQAPALCAFLSKLHLNRGTLRSIIFGPPEYSGLQLLDLCTTEGISQLNLLIGHLRAKDEISQLILIDPSIIQLITGATTCFFHLEFQKYAKWIGIGRLISELDLKFHIRQAYVLVPTQEKDFSLTAIFLQLKVPLRHMKILNSYRLYLQGITLADVVTVDGRKLMESAPEGAREADRQGSLSWPAQQRPDNSSWNLWRNILLSLTSHRKLQQPLGPWIAPSYQQWRWFKNPKSIATAPCNKSVNYSGLL